jgi:diguanylate cyclase (GGDEF)-like protein
VDLAILYLFILLPAFFIRGEKPLKESGLIIAVGILFFLASVALFRAKIYLGFTMPLAGLFTSYITVEMYNFVRVAMEKRKFFKMAVTDGLTGLFNIRYFKMILEAEVTLAKHDPQKQFCVVMSDVDHFKHFNDTYGHQVGDIVLKEVANALKSVVRASDLVSRYGGEEMIVLLRGVDINAAMPLAEKLRKAIEERLVKDGDKTYKVTASLGVSFYRSGDDVDGLIKRADDGLYKSKEGGRNRVSSVEEGAPEVSPPPTPPAA